jgi:DNA/RNA-binding domain of Phe-tRNA-synthetase-like protein
LNAIRTTEALQETYPGLAARAWTAEALDGRAELPPLAATAHTFPKSAAHAENMSRFFREVGYSRGSPVEFQIRKSLDGSMNYSNRSALVDMLLYAEIRCGLIIGLHDLAALSLPVAFGLGREAEQLEFGHISNRQQPVEEDDPVLISNGTIIASLVHGPDRATMIRPETKTVWGVIFAAPNDPQDVLESSQQMACDEGEAHGVWRVLAR